MHILQPHYVNRLEYKCSFSIHPIPSVCSVVSVDVWAECQLDLILCYPIEKSHFIVVSGYLVCVCVCKSHVTDNAGLHQNMLHFSYLQCLQACCRLSGFVMFFVIALSSCSELYCSSIHTSIASHQLDSVLVHGGVSGSFAAHCY